LRGALGGAIAALVGTLILQLLREEFSSLDPKLLPRLFGFAVGGLFYELFMANKLDEQFNEPASSARKT